MNVSISRRITFCAGHRVMGHENKCAQPHGHNYVVNVFARSEDLDSLGRVIDFSVLKEKLKGWIDGAWDHGFLLCEHDIELIDFFKATSAKYYPMKNPTAENIAMHLLDICAGLFADDAITVFRIEVWETENCVAVAEKEAAP